VSAWIFSNQIIFVRPTKYQKLLSNIHASVGQKARTSASPIIYLAAPPILFVPFCVVEIFSSRGVFWLLLLAVPYLQDKYGTALAGLKGKVHGCTL
jgi:hypothetical protein